MDDEIFMLEVSPLNIKTNFACSMCGKDYSISRDIDGKCVYFCSEHDYEYIKRREIEIKNMIREKKIEEMNEKSKCVFPEKNK